MIKYREGYKYQLVEDYTVKTSITPKQDVTKDEWILLKTDGTLTIKDGYAWDGPSGPTIDTKNFMRGSLIHDALYQLMREGLVDEGFFDAANEELRIACLQDGMCKFRAWYIYKGVSLFGKQFAKKQKALVITAP